MRKKWRGMQSGGERSTLKKERGGEGDKGREGKNQ
jgi:hypothetical protein